MRKIIFTLVILMPILMSCEEDENKVIQTDLPTEAAEIFSISKDWNESLYFAMLSWEQYQQMDTVGLPGCPTILLDESSKEVTLNFSESTSCTQTGDYSRSGKLILKFETKIEGLIKKWTMEYDDYFFGSNAIAGTRAFYNDGSDNVFEEFTKIKEMTTDELSTEFSGEFIHARTYLFDSLKSFTSTGSIMGVNAAGRDFEITINSPTRHDISCYNQNEILPNTGKASWYVSRGSNTEVSYAVTYDPLIDKCKVAVNAVLPDGKKLLLNPVE